VTEVDTSSVFVIHLILRRTEWRLCDSCH